MVTQIAWQVCFPAPRRAPLLLMCVFALAVLSCTAKLSPSFDPTAASRDAERARRDDCLKDAGKIGIEKHEDVDAHVVILPGIGGDVGASFIEDDGAAANLETLLEGNTAHLGRTFAAQVLEWDRICPPEALFPEPALLHDDEGNSLRALALASILRDWRDWSDKRKGKGVQKLFLVAGSFGARIACMACKQTDSEGNYLLGPKFFEAIVFVSPFCDCYEIDKQVTGRAKRVFLFHSKKDPCPLMRHAGKYGCPNDIIPKEHQIGYSKNIVPAGSKVEGKHLWPYETDTCRRWLSPIFDSKPGMWNLTCKKWLAKGQT